MKIDATKQKELMEAIDLIRSFVENLEPQKSCNSCCHWDSGCNLYNKAIPPQDIITNGCDKWEIFYIPF